MIINVWGKEGCSKCELLCSLIKHLDYKYYHMQDITDIWLDHGDEALDVQAKYCMVDELPIVAIDGRAYSFDEALDLLGIPYEDGEGECEDGVCRLN